MGGSFSGRWHGHRRATTVEQSHILDLGDLARKGTFVAWRSGTVRWYRADTEIASIGYAVRPHGDGLSLVLSYRWSRADEEGEDIELPIELEATRPHFGGVRWWGRCPLVTSGEPCDRRVGKLYLPPGETFFGCRHCHRLTYRSAQEHDKRVDAFRRNPSALASLMENLESASITQLALALKAIR